MGFKLKDQTMVVVTDGTGAKVFRNRGNGDPKLQIEAELAPKDLDDDGPSGVRPPEQTDQQTDEATFAKQLANYLYQRAHRGDFASMVLIADPQTLGQMRDCMHQTVTDKIIAELDKTLTNSPTEDIEKSLKAAA